MSARQEINWKSIGKGKITTTVEVEDGGVQHLTKEQVQVATLLRIADATELMAGNYIQLQKDMLYYKERADSKQKYIERLEKQNQSLRGVITRMKNQKKKAV